MQTDSSASRTCFEVAVGLGVHGDGLDAEFAAGAQDAQRDLAAVGDDDLLEHARRLSSMTNSGWPNSTGWPFSTRILEHLAGRVGLDLVEDLHRLDDAQGLAVRRPRWPTSTKGLAPGDGAR